MRAIYDVELYDDAKLRQQMIWCHLPSFEATVIYALSTPSLFSSKHDATLEHCRPGKGTFNLNCATTLSAWHSPSGRLVARLKAKQSACTEWCAYSRQPLSPMALVVADRTLSDRSSLNLTPHQLLDPTLHLLGNFHATLRKNRPIDEILIAITMHYESCRPLSTFKAPSDRTTTYSCLLWTKNRR